MVRSTLRLADLEHDAGVTSKLLNVKVPDTLMEQIAAIAHELGCSKTAVVVALLNEGLDAQAEQVAAEQAGATVAAAIDPTAKAS